MAGRPRSLTLYKKKGAQTWSFYRPGFGTVDTGQIDKTMAERVMRGLPQEHEPSMFSVPAEGAPRPPTDDIRSTLSAIAAQSGAQGADPFDASQAGAGSADAGNDAVKLSPNPEPDKLSRPELAILRKLSGAKRDKIIGLLGQGAARLNATVVSLGFGIAGFRFKESYEGLTDEDLEIVKLGYDMWLDDVLDNLELKPAYVVLIGNALLAVGMIPNLERKPKKSKLSIVPDQGGSNGPATG